MTASQVERKCIHMFDMSAVAVLILLPLCLLALLAFMGWSMDIL